MISPVPPGKQFYGMSSMGKVLHRKGHGDRAEEECHSYFFQEENTRRPAQIEDT